MTKTVKLLLAATMFCTATGAQAATFTEDFSPFAGWKSRWFGAQSNAQNYYVSEYNEDPSFQGAADVQGLWLSDGDSYRDPGDYSAITIRFADDFAASLSSFSMDVASALSSVGLTFFDRSGATIGSFTIAQSPTISANFTPIGYRNVSVTSANGIGGFAFATLAQGNVIVDNIQANAVPEPATWGLMILGFGLAGASMRRRSVKVRFA
jgi:hypothetical protein